MSSLEAVTDYFGDPWKKPSRHVVFQHGFSRNHRFWQAWVPFFASTHNVIRPDLPGCGKTQSLVKFPDLDLLVELEHKTIEQHADSPVDYVGESLGGIIGVMLAVRHPEAIRSLTLISTPLHVGKSVTETQGLGMGSWQEAIAEMGMRDWWLKSRAAMKHGDFQFEANADRDAWMADQAATVTIEVARNLVNIIQAVDLRSFAADIRRPVLVLIPEGSRYINDPTQVDHYSKIPNVDIRRVEGVAHEMYIESVDRIAPLVRDFVM